MAEMETITKKERDSFGITLPKELVEQEHLRENQKVIIDIKRAGDITQLRGLGKFKKSAQQLKNEMRAGWK